jgi:hypothetical protein
MSSVCHGAREMVWAMEISRQAFFFPSFPVLITPHLRIRRHRETQSQGQYDGWPLVEPIADELGGNNTVEEGTPKSGRVQNSHSDGGEFALW